MSNKRRLTVKKVTNSLGETMYEAGRKAELTVTGKSDRRPIDRRIKRALRKTEPVAKSLMDHQRPHARQENCGRSCEKWVVA